MITVSVAETGYQGTPVGTTTTIHHNDVERVMFTGKVFSSAYVYEVMLATAAGVHLVVPVTGTISGNGVYLYADLSLRTAALETAIGTLASLSAVIWLYNVTTGNYEHWAGISIKNSPEPTGVTVEALGVPVRYLSVTVLPTGGSIRADTLYRLTVADPAVPADPGYFMHDGSTWIEFGVPV